MSAVIPVSLQSVLRGIPEFRPGHVWLAGAGPGDPALLTLHALSGLAQADVVIHDALVDARTLALARPGAEFIFAGKRGGRPSADQSDINLEMIRRAREGVRVLRLKGGDPYIFGRGADEVLALARHHIPFRVIPGVTAGLAALTMALIPATVRGVNQSLLLITGHPAGNARDDLDWAVVAHLRQPVVLYMALARIAPITQALLAGGLPPETPAAIITSATLPNEQILTTTLRALPKDIVSHDIPAPAIIVIGEIVRTRAELLALMPELAS